MFSPAPGLSPVIVRGTQSVTMQRSIPVFLSAARIISMIGFAVIPVLAVKIELTTALLITDFVFGIASIVFWSWSKSPS